MGKIEEDDERKRGGRHMHGDERFETEAERERERRRGNVYFYQWMGRRKGECDRPLH